MMASPRPQQAFVPDSPQPLVQVNQTPSLRQTPDNNPPRRERRQHDTKNKRNTTKESSDEISDSTLVGDEDEADIEDEDGHADDDDESDDGAPLQASRGLGLEKGRGRGKGPGIRVSGAEESDSLPRLDLEGSEAGLDAHMLHSHPNCKRKRRESNLSNASVLEDDDESVTYPRKKLLRELTHRSDGLLTYANESAVDDTMHDDSDGYEAVNGISNSDEEDADIQAFEEDVVLETCAEDEFRMRRDSQSSIDSDVIDAAIYSSLQAGRDDPFFDELPDIDTLGPQLSIDGKPRRKNSESSTKQVRFADEVEAYAESPSSPSSSSSDFESMYPDLMNVFMDQDALPPNFLADDTDGDAYHAGSDSNESFWDFEEAEASRPRNTAPHSPESGESGYESDSSILSGDTTEEEDPPPSSVVADAKSVLLDPSSAPQGEIDSPTPFQRGQKNTKARRRGPRLGVFVLDPNKAALSADPISRSIITTRAVAPRAGAFFNAPAAAAGGFINGSPVNANSESDGSDRPQTRGGGVDIMFGGMFGLPGGAFNFGSDIAGPPEAFYPWANIEANGRIITEELDDEDMSQHGDFNLHEFMNLGDEHDHVLEEDDDGEDFEATATDAESTVFGLDSTPVAGRVDHSDIPSSEGSDSRRRSIQEALLEHFDRGNVAAFRNNQLTYSQVARQPADPDLRASASKPLRSGKTAEAPITPARRRRTGSNVGRKPVDIDSPLYNRSSAAVTKRPPPRMGTFA